MFDSFAFGMALLGIPFAAVAISTIASKWIDFKRYQVDMLASQAAATNGQLENKVAELARRLATLEAIATDPAVTLSRSIDALPDPARKIEEYAETSGVRS